MALYIDPQLEFWQENKYNMWSTLLCCQRAVSSETVHDDETRNGDSMRFDSAFRAVVMIPATASSGNMVWRNVLSLNLILTRSIVSEMGYLWNYLKLLIWKLWNIAIYQCDTQHQQCPKNRKICQDIKYCCTICITLVCRICTSSDETQSSSKTWGKSPNFCKICSFIIGARSKNLGGLNIPSLFVSFIYPSSQKARTVEEKAKKGYVWKNVRLMHPYISPIAHQTVAEIFECECQRIDTWQYVCVPARFAEFMKFNLVDSILRVFNIFAEVEIGLSTVSLVYNGKTVQSMNFAFVTPMGHGSYVMGHGSIFVWVSGSWVTGSDPLPALAGRTWRPLRKR